MDLVEQEHQTGVKVMEAVVQEAVIDWMYMIDISWNCISQDVYFVCLDMIHYIIYIYILRNIYYPNESIIINNIGDIWMM